MQKTQRYILVFIYGTVLILDRVDLTIVNIILPTMADYFHVSLSAVQWVNQAFFIAMTVSIPLSAWTADKFGDKYVFVASTVMFGAASIVCAYAPNFLVLLAARFVQGLSGGMIVPVGMTMVFRVFKPSEYVGISSLIMLPTLIAPALSPSLGGLILLFADWQWVFLFAVPICMVVIVLSLRFLDNYKLSDVPKFDVIGCALLSAGLFLILLTLSELSRNGITWQLMLSAVFALLFTRKFLQHEKTCKNPMLYMNLLANKLFVKVNWIQFWFQIAHFGALFLCSVYLQMSVGMTAMYAGLVIGMQAFGSMCSTRVSVYLFHRFGPSIPLMLGFSGMVIISPLILLINEYTYLGHAMALLFVRGLFTGLCGAPVQAISLIGFKNEVINHSNAVFGVVRQLSISFGVALLTLLVEQGLHIMHITDMNLEHVNHLAFVGAFAGVSCSAFFALIITCTLNNNKIIAQMHDY
jgi:EmrB/QacA subfamily drug resistance transporter